MSARTNVIRNNLTVAAGAGISANGGLAYNTNGTAQIDGELDLNARANPEQLTQRIGSLTGSGNVFLSNTGDGANATLEITGDITDESLASVFNGDIVGEITLLKSGDNFQTLAGDMTYSGTTTVSGGGLLIDGIHLGGGAYTVDGGILGGSGTIDSNVTVTDDGVLSPGDLVENSTGTLEIGADLELGDQTSVWMDLDSVSSNDQLIVSGSASLAGVLDLTSTAPSAYSIGDTMTLVSALGGVNGRFTSVVGVQVGDVDGLSSGLAVQYEADGVDARVTILGDANFDNQVDVVGDAFQLIASLGRTSGASFANGDFNGDGQVDVINDAFVLIGNLNSMF